MNEAERVALDEIDRTWPQGRRHEWSLFRGGDRQFYFDGDPVSAVQFLALLRDRQAATEAKLTGYVDTDALRVYHPPA